MRTIIFVITFLSSFCCFSQVTEDFSDGDFTQNPIWTGDTNKFIVDSKKQLRLNASDDQAGFAGLYTKSTIVKGTIWEFYTHLLFNPSANNYCLFYLANTESGYSDNSNGYAVKIGGEKDRISLCRINQGKLTPLIEGRELMKENSSPQLNIKVTCDEDGNWSLWTQSADSENNYIKEGTIKDLVYSESSFIGVGCLFTSSRNKSFIFDNISVTRFDTPPVDPDHPEEPTDPPTPDPEDNTPPKIISLTATSDTIVSIKFDEAVNVGKASFYIDKSHNIKNKSLSDSNRKLDLLLSSPLENNRNYTLTLEGINDLAGNRMQFCSIQFKYYDNSMQSATFGELVFNEIMPNPKGITTMPESEYIELFNRTDLSINLKNWKLGYGNKAYLLPEYIVKPEGYVVLCPKKHIEEWNKSGTDVLGMTSFPTLANSGKLIYLEDSRNKLIAWLNYSDAWYQDDFKKEGGFSLECIDPDNLSGNANNWKASVAGKGGTPGNENSVKAVFPDETQAEISYYFMSAPDTLTICFTKPMDIQSLSDKSNYQLDNPEYSILKAIPEYPEAKSVALALSGRIQKETVIESTGLKDISGYDLEGELSFKINIPEEPEAGDLVFNEIMFNPFPGQNDYVELYNMSDKYIPLESLRFTSQKPDGSYSDAIPLGAGKRIFTPRTYLCFTHSPESLNDSYTICRNKLLIINSLPTLPDDKGNILLTTPNGRILDRFFYTEKMHSSLIDNKEGIALEKIHPAQDSQSSANWLSASSASGGGTPGCRNSQYREPSEEPEKTFWLENDSFSPDGDGINEEMILQYHVTGENYLANIKVFDAGGHLIKILAEDFRLETDGFFIWNGKNNDDLLASIGIYVVYIEIYNPAGEAKHFKLACAVTK